MYILVRRGGPDASVAVLLPPSPAPKELPDRLDLLERRIVLIERALARIAALAPGPDRQSLGRPVWFACDASDLRVVNAYPCEWDEDGAPFRWMSGLAPIQFVAPVPDRGPGFWRLHLLVHPNVDLGPLRVIVDDRVEPFVLRPGAPRGAFLECLARSPRGETTSLVLEGLRPIRPSEIDGAGDPRWIALGFYGIGFVPIDEARSDSVAGSPA